MNLRVVHLTPWYLTAVMAALWAGSVAAQTGPSSGVWRCGTLLTNQPRADQSCEPVSTVSSTVVEGTRVGGSRGATTSSSARTQSAGPGVSASDAGGTESSRESARALLRAELHEQEQRWQHLQSMWNQGRPAPTPQQPAGSAQYHEFVTGLRQQLLRTEADLAALRRELARLP